MVFEKYLVLLSGHTAIELASGVPRHPWSFWGSDQWRVAKHSGGGGHVGRQQRPLDPGAPASFVQAPPPPPSVNGFRPLVCQTRPQSSSGAMVGSSGLLASQSTLSVAQMFVDIGALRARDAENHAAVARVLRHWFQFREFRRCRLVKEAMGFNYDRFLFAVAREWSAGRPEWALWRYERFRPDRPTTDFPTTPLSVSSCSRGGGRGFAGSGSERSLDARGIRTARTGLAPAIRCSSAPQTPRRPPVSSGGGGCTAFSRCFARPGRRLQTL